MNESKEDDLEKALFCQPALLSSDSRPEFNLLRETLGHQIQPKDAIEKLWAAEVIEAAFETQRLHRFKAAIVKTNMPRAVRTLMNQLAHYTDGTIGNDISPTRAFDNMSDRSCAALVSTRPRSRSKPFCYRCPI